MATATRTSVVDELGATTAIRASDSNESPNGKSKVREEAETLSTIIVYSLILIVVCLAIFNLYLLNWIWITLSSGDEVSTFGTPGKRLPVDLLASTQATLKFTNGQLTASSSLEVESISGFGGDLTISTASQMQANQIDILGSKGKRQVANPIEFWAKNEKLLEFSSSGGVKFPAGFSVRHVQANSSSFVSDMKSNLVLNCKPETQTCNLHAQIIKFPHKSGLDFNANSVRLSRLQARRLHSSTNSLNLRTNGDIGIESLRDSIELQSLEDLAISSHNEAVILNSNFINISRTINYNSSTNDQNQRIKTQPSRNNGHKNVYRLCICLDRRSYQQNQFVGSVDSKQTTVRSGTASSTRRQPPTSARILSNANGLVFAIRAHLSCIKFTPFCGSLDFG